MKLLVGMYLTLCLTSSAQITTSITSNSDGRLCVTITNHSKATLTAYFASWAAQDQRPGHMAFQYHDSLIGAYHPIPPGGTGILTAETIPPEIRAAVFDDGSTYGDPDWVRMILSRRGQWLAATEAALKDLETAIARNTPQAEMAQQLTVSRDAQIASHVLKSQPPEADAHWRRTSVPSTRELNALQMRLFSCLDITCGIPLWSQDRVIGN